MPIISEATGFFASSLVLLGCCSAANGRMLSRRRIRGYIATGQQKHGGNQLRRSDRPKPPHF
jgi:hypothetical protein